MATIINASTSAGLIQTADTSGTLQLQSNGVTQQTIDSTGSYGQLARGTAVASTSGTAIDFTSIPSWVKRITVMFNGVSTSGTSNYLVRIGSGSVDTTGYSSSGLTQNSSGGLTAPSDSTGFITLAPQTAASACSGAMTILNVSGNIWVSSGAVSGGVYGQVSGGTKTLAGTLDRVRITTVNGTDTFDAGSINILYE